MTTTDRSTFRTRVGHRPLLAGALAAGVALGLGGLAAAQLGPTGSGSPTTTTIDDRELDDAPTTTGVASTSAVPTSTTTPMTTTTALTSP